MSKSPRFEPKAITSTVDVRKASPFVPRRKTPNDVISPLMVCFLTRSTSEFSTSSEANQIFEHARGSPREDRSASPGSGRRSPDARTACPCRTCSSLGHACDSPGATDPDPSVSILHAKPGDTLAKLARSHQVSLGELMRLNPEAVKTLHPGDEVRLPSSPACARLSPLPVPTRSRGARRWPASPGSTVWIRMISRHGTG